MGVFHRSELYTGAWPDLLGEPTCPGHCRAAANCLPGCSHPHSSRMQCLQITDGQSLERRGPHGGAHHRRQPDTAGYFHSTCHWPGIQWCQVQRGCSYEMKGREGKGKETGRIIFEKRYLCLFFVFIFIIFPIPTLLLLFKIIFSIQLIDHMIFNWDIEIYLHFNIHALSEREVD